VSFCETGELIEGGHCCYCMGWYYYKMQCELLPESGNARVVVGGDYLIILVS
jgi:hypothetical protein